MASLLDIGRSAIHAQREALNVTGQNIANANTEGYHRRDATLSEVSGVQSELTSLTAQTGMGVRLDDVRRAYDSFRRTANARRLAGSKALMRLSPNWNGWKTASCRTMAIWASP